MSRKAVTTNVPKLFKGAAALDRSDSLMEFIVEVKGDPKKERWEKPVVKMTPPVVDSVVVDVLEEDGDSDDPDRDRIILQRLKVKLETERLAKYEAEYVLKMKSRRKKR